MKSTKRLFIFIILIINLGCSQSSDHIFIADQVTELTAHQLKKEKGLSLIAIGGPMMDDVQGMGAEFEYFHLVTLQEARKLIIYTAQTYLKNINSNKKIRPYLHNYPFSIKNIRVVILINQPNGAPPAEGNIRCISIVNGILNYDLVSPSKFEPMPLLLEESYETALKILEENP